MLGPHLIVLTAYVLLASPLASQQRPAGRVPASGRPQGTHGQVPQAPPARRQPTAKPEPERSRGGHVNQAPHVSGGRWYGHAAPNDPRYRMVHPFPHGRFTRLGPLHRYSIVRLDRRRHRFGIRGGFLFEVVVWEWPICADWCWQCADDFVIYDDPDHIGWYLLYNVRTGVYVHVSYLGT